MFFITEFIICFMILIVSSIIFVYKKFYSKNLACILKIPGPKGHFIIGHTLQFLQKTPEELFVMMQEMCSKYFPIFKIYVAFKPVVVLLNPEDIKIVLSSVSHTPNTFSFCSNWLENGILNSKGVKWFYRRQIIAPVFNSNIVLDFVKVVNEETKQLVKNFGKTAGKEINVVPHVSEFSLLVMNETVVGTKLKLKDDDYQKYKLTINRMAELLRIRHTSLHLQNQIVYDFTKLGQEEKQITAVLQHATKLAIKERQKDFNKNEVIKKKDDAKFCNKRCLSILDFLLLANCDDDINFDGIAEEINSLIFAGHDTATSALSCALLCLALNPDVQEKIVAEIQEKVLDSKTSPSLNDLQKLKYTERCIREVLRMFPSVPVISRVTNEIITTHTGYEIPENTTILINVLAMHMHPNVYPEPEKFDPDRFLPENIALRHKFSYLPFSAGPRSCIGEKFVILEVKAALVGVLNEFCVEPAMKIEDLVFLPDLVLRANGNGVKVKFVPRNKRV